MNFESNWGFAAKVALTLAFSLSLGFMCGAARAQGPTQTPTRTVAAPAQAGIADRDEVDPKVAAEIRMESRNIKLASYLSAVVALVVGLGVFVYRRRHLMTFSKVSGAATTAILSVAMLLVLSIVFSTPEGEGCASAVLYEGSKAKEYDDICGPARESASNAFGLVSAFRATFIPDGTEFIVPVGAGVLKFLMYVSVLLASLIAFFIFRPLAEKYFVLT